MDTFESNATNEQPGAMYGTYQATAMQVVSVAMSDNFTPGSTYSDDFGTTPDTFTYNLGSGTITSGLDGEARFSGTVITAGSTTPQPVTFSVYQLQNGATFVRLPDGYKINQLTISSMVADGYDSITTDASSTSTVVCFVKGTWIETPSGHRRIEDISAGDLVLTEDRGPQRVIRNAHWSVATTSRTAPVHIASGAFGAGQPFAPLRLSRQHRVYITSPVAQRMFESPGALVAAHHLIGLPGITLEPEDQVHLSPHPLPKPRTHPRQWGACRDATQCKGQHTYGTRSARIICNNSTFPRTSASFALCQKAASLCCPCFGQGVPQNRRGRHKCWRRWQCLSTQTGWQPRADPALLNA